jgi:hypothetical protein
MPPPESIVATDPRVARLAISIAIALCSLLGLRGCLGVFQYSDGHLLTFSMIIVAAVVLLLVIGGVVATKQIDFTGVFSPSAWLGKK